MYAPIPDEQRSPGRQAPSSAAGRMIVLEIRLRELGRAEELRPDGWAFARQAFGLATEVRLLRAELCR